MEVLGYVRHKDTGEVKEYFAKDVNGFDIGYNIGKGMTDWVSGNMWEETSGPMKTTYEEVAIKIGQLVDKKNAQYGDAHGKSGEFLKILYPNGIQPEQYKDALTLVRIFDKQMRIANGNQGEENGYNDIAGYGILMSGE